MGLVGADLDPKNVGQGFIESRVAGDLHPFAGDHIGRLVAPDIAGQHAGPAKHRAGADDRYLDRPIRTRHRPVAVIKVDARRVKLAPVSQIDTRYHEGIGCGAAAFDNSNKAFGIALELVPNQLRVFVAGRRGIDLLVGRVIAGPAVHSRRKRADCRQHDRYRQVAAGEQPEVVQADGSARTMVGGPDFQAFRVGKHFLEFDERAFKRNPIGFSYRCREGLPALVHPGRRVTEPLPSAFIAKNAQLHHELGVGTPRDAGDIKNKARIRERKVIDQVLGRGDEPLFTRSERVPDSGVPVRIPARAGPGDARVSVADACSRQGACYIVTGPAFQTGFESGFAQRPNRVDIGAVDRCRQKSLDGTARPPEEKEPNKIGSGSQPRMRECVDLNSCHAQWIDPGSEIRQTVPNVFGSHILAEFHRELEVLRRRSHEFHDKARCSRRDHDIEPVHTGYEGLFFVNCRNLNEYGMPVRQHCRGSQGDRNEEQ